MGDRLRHRKMGAGVIPLRGALLSVEGFIRLRRVPTMVEKDGKGGMKIWRGGMATAKDGMTTEADEKTIGEATGEAISEGGKVIETTTDSSEKSAKAKAKKEEV